MKKVGLIITMNGVNYGMLLQAYATQYYLDKLGVNTEIIRIKASNGVRGYVSKLEYLKFLWRPIVFRIAFNKRLRRKRVSSIPVLHDAWAKRKRVADKFVKERFHDIMFFPSEDSAHEAVKDYDAVLVGSDQQWNPGAFYNNITTLMFVPDEVKKISYATSLGVSSIPKYLSKRGKKFLSRIDYLSVREKAGKKIIDSLVGSEKAVVVLDPTLLLTREEWDTMIVKKKMINEPYVFCYFLGDNIEYLKIVQKFCLNNSYKMVVVRNIETYTGEVSNVGDVIHEGPSVEEFVNYIRFASLICTDSFHGTIFSIIYKRQFVTFYRFNSSDNNSRNSRIDDFLGELGLLNRIYNKEKDIDKIVQNLINYYNVDQCISALRQDSISFLNKALK